MADPTQQELIAEIQRRLSDKNHPENAQIQSYIQQNPQFGQMVQNAPAPQQQPQGPQTIADLVGKINPILGNTVKGFAQGGAKAFGGIDPNEMAYKQAMTNYLYTGKTPFAQSQTNENIAKTGQIGVQTEKTSTEAQQEALNLKMMQDIINGNNSQPNNNSQQPSYSTQPLAQQQSEQFQQQTPPTQTNMIQPSQSQNQPQMQPKINFQSQGQPSNPPNQGQGINYPSYDTRNVPYVPGPMSSKGGVSMVRNPFAQKAGEEQISNQAALQRTQQAIPPDVQKTQIENSTTSANEAALMIQKLDQLKSLHDKALAAPGINRANVDKTLPLAIGTRISQQRQAADLAIQGPNNPDWENYNKALFNFSTLADRGMFGEKGKLIALQLSQGTKLFPKSTGTAQGDAGLWNVLYSVPRKTIAYQNQLVDQYGADPSLKVPLYRVGETRQTPDGKTITRQQDGTWV